MFPYDKNVSSKFGDGGIRCWQLNELCFLIFKKEPIGFQRSSIDVV